MTTSLFPPPPEDAFKNARQKDRLLTALRYAELGWPVLPGADWDGTGWRNPRTGRAVEAGPTVPREYASIDRETIIEWWNVDGAFSPTVLLHAVTFDVLSVPVNVGRVARKLPEFSAHPTPVAYRPDTGMEYFLTRLDSLNASGGPHTSGSLMVMKPGSWILVPPADVSQFRHVEWRHDPDQVNGQLAPFIEIIGLIIRAQNIFTRGPN